MYTIKEVHYDDNDAIVGWTLDDMTPYGESPEELKQSLQWMLEACEHPVLEVDPDNDNKLIGVELGQVTYDDEEYEVYDSIEELLASLDDDVH